MNRRYILHVLEATGGNRPQTARILGLDRKAPEGHYTFGKGHVFIQRKHPAYYSRSQEAADVYRAVVRQAAEAAGLPYKEHNFLRLRRGPYVIAACLRESVGDTPLDRRIEYDLYYIRNWSLALDVRILFLTVARVFRDSSAH